jgi:hypothetical protein
MVVGKWNRREDGIGACVGRSSGLELAEQADLHGRAGRISGTGEAPA